MTKHQRQACRMNADGLGTGDAGVDWQRTGTRSNKEAIHGTPVRDERASGRPGVRRERNPPVHRDADYHHHEQRAGYEINDRHGHTPLIPELRRPLAH